jgi:hypothetical protein
MDLESTLVRAESLFKRFQRTVEIIDKKANFPSPPQARHRKTQSATDATSEGSSSGPSTQAEASSSGSDKGKQVADAEEGEAKVISPELRALLSRKIEKLDKQEIVEHGGGVGS